MVDIDPKVYFLNEVVIVLEFYKGVLIRFVQTITHALPYIIA